MKRLGLVFMLLPVSLLAVRAQTAPRFQAIDVWVESDLPLVAYQIEVRASVSAARVVGIEGGEGPPYAEPPFYDPAAMRGERVVLGAFTTSPDAPNGRFRVARIHMQEPAGEETDYKATVVTAAAPGGETLALRVELKRLELKSGGGEE